MHFNVISSGSKGNAAVIVSEDTVILIDMGIALSRLEEGLKELDLEVKDIDAALFTHDHSDHIAGLKFLSPKIMYALEGTLPSSLSNIVKPFEPFTIKSLKITPIPTSHDATNPCGYVLENEKEKLVYVTDTGVFPEESMKYCKDPDYIILESNHDIRMLLHTNRTFQLKQRILSDMGHLCNEDSAIAAIEMLGPRTKEIVLAHLSEEANTPEQALRAYREVFDYYHVDMDRYKVRCANQHHSLIGGDVS